MDESSKKVVVLQTLDSLWSLPVSFEETIKGANEGLKKQLGDQLLNDEFLPMGDMFVRNVMGPSGDMETQVLPGYNFFQYIKPTKLPELKDSNNRTWDLTNYKALTEEGAPTTTELQSMVKLAREQMAQDFKKTYDPENTSNRETAAIAFDPAAQAKVFQSAQSALQRLFTDPKTALEFAQADDDGKAAMRESAMNSGYLVGPTEGGAFGDHHFQQFFAILKMKEKYNEIKNKGQALQSDPLYKGFEGVGGAGAAKFYVQNKSTINAIDSVLSTIPVVNRINPLAIMKSVVNGGIIGLVTNVASVVTEVVSTVVSTIATAGTATTIVSMDYSYEQGFGAKVDVGVGIGPARISYATIGYSEFGGFEASVGVTGKLGPVEVGARMTYSEKNGFGASASAGVGPFTAGLTYSQQGGLSAAVGYKNANGVVVGLGWSEKGGVSASVGMATKGGYEGGVSFNKDEGFGAYAAKNEFNKNNQITGSKAITFNERDGVGVKITDKDPSGANSGLGIDPHTSVSISQRGGVTVDYENANGFGGSVNVGWNGSYSGSVTQKYDAGTNARGVRTVNFDSEGNFSGSNKTSMISRGSLAGGQDDVDWQNGIALGQGSLMGAMESVSENVAKNYAEMDAAKKAAVIAASKKPGSKIKQADLDNWDTLSEDDKEAIVQKNLSGNESGQHETRTGVWNRLKGAVEDFSDQLSGNYSDDSGWMEDIKDSDGNVIGQKFVNRTCFVAGTLVHTKDGLKKIEEIKVGDVVLSKSDVSGEISYRRVVNTFVRQADAIYKVSFEDGTVLETTWSHRFRILKRDSIGQEFKIGTTEWTQANKLVAGDVTLTVEGETLKVTTILIDQREETVYNFEVEEDHTYFVAEVGIWVHNDAYHSVEVAAWLKYKDSKDPKDLAEFNRIKKRNDRQRIIDRAYSDEDKILLEKKINNEYSQDGELVKSEIKRAIERADEIKDSKLRKIFRNQSIKDTQDEICNVNGMYMMLKEEGANVGSLSDFIIRHVNNGAIVANQENRGYVRIGNFNKFVEGYQINGQNLRLNITDNYSQAFNSGAKMIAAKDPGHMWGMGRDKSNQLFIADPYYNSSNRYSILPNFNQFGRSTHGSHPIVTQYFYIEKEND
ncbi:Hint domain-containing protein [Leptospira yasudae]|uniref:Hint domain-containing protein n=1 Tax=Leptospira yasudae TaxID=2202201 RepID=UPI001AEFB440|nr:Hint domain-containing protein [Leptospira yasudae]